METAKYYRMHTLNKQSDWSNAICHVHLLEMIYMDIHVMPQPH